MRQEKIFDEEKTVHSLGSFDTYSKVYVKIIKKFMKVVKIFLAILFCAFWLFSCSKDKGEASLDGAYGEAKSDNGNGGSSESGVITAGEWNDLENWDYWNELLTKKEFADKPEYWGFNTKNRVSVVVKNSDEPVCNAKLELKKGQNTIWTAMSDNRGTAELWIGMQENDFEANISEYSLYIDENKVVKKLKLYKDGINKIELNKSSNSKTVELSFIVDATGSMGDELEFLKDDLGYVISSVQDKSNNAYNIYTSCVFYRDEGDDYVVKKSDFTNDLSETISFINKQQANGGGDFPEAVHSALITAIDELQWSNNSHTKIAFLLLDAPPHYNQDVLKAIHREITKAAKKGIKIIPITASGIDKETEFLMRYMAIATNGTYVFITNHSGIGNDHIEASVGEYEVEFLNQLMIRLIKKYIE